MPRVEDGGARWAFRHAVHPVLQARSAEDVVAGGEQWCVHQVAAYGASELREVVLLPTVDVLGRVAHRRPPLEWLGQPLDGGGRRAALLDHGSPPCEKSRGGNCTALRGSRLGGGARSGSLKIADIGTKRTQLARSVPLPAYHTAPLLPLTPPPRRTHACERARRPGSERRRAAPRTGGRCTAGRADTGPGGTAAAPAPPPSPFSMGSQGGGARAAGIAEGGKEMISKHKQPWAQKRVQVSLGCAEPNSAAALHAQAQRRVRLLSRGRAS